LLNENSKFGAKVFHQNTATQAARANAGKQQIFRQNKAGVNFHFVKSSDDNESRELRIIDFVEMKTKKGPDLKAIKKSCKNLTESNKGMQYVWIQVLD
jgi:hypothetical protein